MQAATALPPTAVGENIAVLRKSKDLSQQALANRAKISKSLLSKIEIGDRACRPAVAAAIAGALGVPLSTVYGQPYAESPDPELINQLRWSVRRHRHPQVAEDIRPEDLTADVEAASRLRASTSYRELLPTLPDLIARTVAHAHDSAEPTAWELLVNAYACAFTIAHRLGYPDLADLIAARQEWAASQTWTPVAAAAAAWSEAGTFQSAGDYLEGLAVTDRALTTLTGTGTGDIDAVVAAGSLHLRGATLASRARDEATTQHHLTHARRLAEALPADEYRNNLTFGPGNLILHEMATHIELDRPKRAASMADDLVDATLPGLAPTRIGHLHIDAARAHLAAGDRDAALQSLLRARDEAPQMARIHPMAREVLRVLVSLHRRSKPELTILAKWAGLHEAG